jgi:O-glycosyl hydrolase
MKKETIKTNLISCTFLLLALVTQLPAETSNVKNVVLNADKQFQTIDGFGANLDPDQWRDGNLKYALDLLVDDLGCTLFRFDCYGQADWLDPAKRDKDGRYPDDYLQQVYTSKVFKDAWETYRYLQSKGVKLFLNVSGRIPSALAGPDGQRLVDYDGYAEMVVTLLKWARHRENLHFTLFAPYNETDLGSPEGPKMLTEDCLPATKAILKKMDEAGLQDVKLMVMDDSNVQLDKLDEFLNDSSLVQRIACFAGHTYGDGLYEDGQASWFLSPSKFKKIIERIRKSPYENHPFWMTEYGDLDQSEEIEFKIAWLSTRRLLKFLNDGASAGLVWDAFDNFHKHDSAWSIYGLLKTDRKNWKYTPKPRFYSAKQVFRFVKPGFQRVEIFSPDKDADDVYSYARFPLRHILLSAFVSPDHKDFTLVGMSTIEHDVTINLTLKGLAPEGQNKSVSYYRTSRNENCRKIEKTQPKNNTVKALIKEETIFTLTTLD